MTGEPLDRRRCWHVRDGIYPPHTMIRMQSLQENTSAPRYDLECELCAFCAGTVAAKLDEMVGERRLLPAPAEDKRTFLERRLDQLLTRWEQLADAHRLRGEYAAASVYDQCCADLDQLRRDYQAATNGGT